MSRRNITVAGTTYRWSRTRDRNSVVVFPPAGGGGPRVLPLPPDHVGHPYDDGACPVTPGLVADLIHRHLLKQAPPPRTPPARPRPVPARKPDPAWETATDAPRAYLLWLSLSAAGTAPATFMVEAHREPATAAHAAQAMRQLGPSLQAHFLAVMRWRARGRCGAFPAFRGNHLHGTGMQLPALEAWMESALDAGATALDEVAFHVHEVPYRVPAEAVRERWARYDWPGREAARSLSRLAMPAA